MVLLTDGIAKPCRALQGLVTSRTCNIKALQGPARSCKALHGYAALQGPAALPYSPALPCEAHFGPSLPWAHFGPSLKPIKF